MHTLIKQIRTYLNMSQTEFAKQVNVTFATVNHWENGRAVPNKLAQSKMLFHTMDPVLAIEDLKEIHNQKH